MAGPAQLNVMVSAAGRRGALVRLIRRSLDTLSLAGNVFACDVSPLTAAGQLADELFLVPPCDDPRFADAILGLCTAHDIGLVVPTTDTELPAYAAARRRFADQGVHVLCSGSATVELAADKRRTSAWLARGGHPFVATADVAVALADRSRWPLPLFAKPARGSGSVGARRVTTEEELAAVASEPDMIVQPVVRGVEYTADVWVDPHGAGVTSVVLRQRLEVRGGEVTKAVTRQVPPVEEACRAVAGDLPDALGPLTIQAFDDTDGIHIVDLNPHFGGGYPLGFEAGARTVEWGLAWAVGRPPHPRTFRPVPDLVMLRYDEGVFRPEDELR